MLLVAIVLWPLQGYAQNSVLEVITLKYRTAEQVIPVLKPLLGKDGTLSGMQNQLIVRTSPANLADIKKVLVTLDAMPRRLMIKVGEGRVVAQRGAAFAAGCLHLGNARCSRGLLGRRLRRHRRRADQASCSNKLKLCARPPPPRAFAPVPNLTYT